MADKRTAPPRKDESQIAEEAARWFAALKTAGDAQQAQFAVWLRQSPRHVHYFLHTTALEGVLEGVDPDREFDIQSLVREARTNVAPLGAHAAAGKPLPILPLNNSRTDAHAPRRRRAPRAAWFGIAATLALAAWLTTTHLWGWQSYTTRTGEQRAVELADGSIVHLNTGSRLQVRIDKQTRDLRLRQGEALFIVRRDPTRPFLVHVEDSVIQAVGTQFNVYRRPQGVRVSVLEGLVRITGEQTKAAASVAGGEEAEIRTNGQVHQRHIADIGSTVTWRQRRLVFRSDPLREVVAEFNRYNRSPKIRLDGFDGASRHYTGTFNADDPEAFAVVLSEEKAIAIERTADEIIIRRGKPQ